MEEVTMVDMADMVTTHMLHSTTIGDTTTGVITIGITADLDLLADLAVDTEVTTVTTTIGTTVVTMETMDTMVMQASLHSMDIMVQEQEEVQAVVLKEGQMDLEM